MTNFIIIDPIPVLLFSVGDVQQPLMEIAVDDFLQPIMIATRSYFLTARAAARHMMERGSIVGAFQLDAPDSPATLAAYLEALDQRDRSIQAWEQYFQTWDALLCPAAAVTAFPHCEPGTPLQSTIWKTQA